MSEKTEKTAYDKLVDWFDVKFGFQKTPLKPVPDFTLNPIYWLGALLAVTFALQATTGIFMLLNYVPTPAEAYSSTLYIINSVPLGHLAETMHLYTAYAMILLTLLHLLRNFYGSAHKGNRDLMWLAGIGLGGIVVVFGVTGYLLPWTVISKSATDVAIGFANFFPPQLADLGRFFLVGSGTDASQLNSFLHIHTVILPLLLIAFLGLKIYMYEVHGPAYVPAYGKPKVAGGKYVRWFPKLFLFAIMLGATYIAILVALSSIFPLELPPAFSAATAGNYVVQPDWYLLWVYQILKVQAFEGGAAAYAFVGVIIAGLLVFLLPFYDRSKRRDLGQRPLFVTIGTILVMEFIVLTVWGYLTPGQTIPTYQAVLILGGTAIATGWGLWAVYRLRRNKTKPTVPIQPVSPAPNPSSAPIKSFPQRTTALAGSIKNTGRGLLNPFTVAFAAFLVMASVSLATLVNSLGNLGANIAVLAASAVAFGFSMYVMSRMLRRYVLAYEQEAPRK